MFLRIILAIAVKHEAVSVRYEADGAFHDLHGADLGGSLDISARVDRFAVELRVVDTHKFIDCGVPATKQNGEGIYRDNLVLPQSVMGLLRRRTHFGNAVSK